jgi:methylmalonyl-CoA/ethylmalonyl-CoA epimerase
MTPPRLRVDHVSIAVDSIDRARDFFLEHFPAVIGNDRQDGYGDPIEFRWADFTIGNFKIEVIESARPGSFVERFLERRGQGLHHLSLQIDELDPMLERLERSGVRIVDRLDEGNGSKTAFISPRSAFGILVQFWQHPELADPIPPSWGGIVEKAGVRWQVDHLSLALRSLAPAVRFFQGHFGASVEVEPHLGYDQSFRLLQMRLRDYRLELMESASEGGFLSRFLARRGQGMHHISIDVEDLDEALVPFERAGVRIVDRLDFAPGWKTAFLHPRSAFGVLLQFWQMPIDQWSRSPV